MTVLDAATIDGMAAKAAPPMLRITPAGAVRGRTTLQATWRRLQVDVRRIALITRAEMKITYFGKSLGWLWLLIEPILMSLMYWFLVAVLFDLRKEDTQRFVTILALVVLWLWFSRTVLLGPGLFNSYASLLRDTDFSIMVGVAIAVARETVTFGLNLLVVSVVLACYGFHPGLSILYFPLLCLVLLMVMLTLLMLFAVVGIFIKDLGGFLGQFITVLWYMSPALYSADLAKRKMGQFVWIMELNPLYWLFPAFEKVIIQNSVPDIRPILILMAICAPLLVAGFLLLRRARHYAYYFL